MNASMDDPLARLVAFYEHLRIDNLAQLGTVYAPDAHFKDPFNEVRGLGSEAVEKLTAHRPGTVGQARRIPGVTPAAVSLLLVALKRGTEPAQPVE